MISWVKESLSWIKVHVDRRENKKEDEKESKKQTKEMKKAQKRKWGWEECGVGMYKLPSHSFIVDCRWWP